MGTQVGSNKLKEIIATDDKGEKKRVYEVVAVDANGKKKLIYYDGRDAQHDDICTKINQQLIYTNKDSNGNHTDDFPEFQDGKYLLDANTNTKRLALEVVFTPTYDSKGNRYFDFGNTTRQLGFTSTSYIDSGDYLLSISNDSLMFWIETKDGQNYIINKDKGYDLTNIKEIKLIFYGDTTGDDLLNIRVLIKYKITTGRVMIEISFLAP